jgi:ATP-dependent helicase/nuclease subunit A
LENGPDSQPSFFTIEEIPVYDGEHIRRAEKQGSRFSNDQKGLNAFLNAARQFYDKAGTIETPQVRGRHLTPTSLPPAGPLAKPLVNMPAGFSITPEFSGKNSSDIFEKVDTILERYAKKEGEGDEKFNSGGFGTIAHICVEALLAGSEPQIPPRLAGFISPADADVFLNAGKELALRFLHSPLGIIAGESKERKSEFPFRSLFHTQEKKEIFISGTIDLVFEDAQSVYVVDFKTDSQELPGGHIPQMACYYRAASDLFAVPQKKECGIWLYYLRSGHAVEVTGQAKGFVF